MFSLLAQNKRGDSEPMGCFVIVEKRLGLLDVLAVLDKTSQLRLDDGVSTAARCSLERRGGRSKVRKRIEGSGGENGQVASNNQMKKIHT